MTSTSRNLGIDFILFNNKLSGEFDIFERKLTGLPAARSDVLIPVEVGYTLPNENLESEANRGFEAILRYTDRAFGLDYSIGPNITVARQMVLDRYAPRYSSAWDRYRNASEHRWAGVNWGYIVDGQFQTVAEIENHPVDLDGQGNRTLLPGDLIYRDLNGDRIVNVLDQDPIGFGVWYWNHDSHLVVGLAFSVVPRDRKDRERRLAEKKSRR